MRIKGELFFLALSAAALAGCPGPGGGGSGGGSGGGGGGNCTLPPTITSNMTLSATACPVWHVTANGTTVAGSGSPVLTIDPGVTVAIDKGGFLSVGTSAPGGLVAVGTPTAGITFTSGAAAPAPGDWSAVALGDATLPSSTLAYATFDYGSGVGQAPNTSSTDGYTYTEPAGALIVYGGTSSTSLVLHDLTFSHDQGNGLVYDNFKAGFGAGSGNLHVKDWGSGFEPFVMAANQAWTIPMTIQADQAGGMVDLIRGAGWPNGGTGTQAPITGDFSKLTQSWPSIPIPYFVDGDVPGAGGGAYVEGSGSNVATLVIAAPNELLFKAGGYLEVDPGGNGRGALDATATASAPITFGSVLPSAPPGSWGGIRFNVTNGTPGALSSLSGVTIDSAGDSAASELIYDRGGNSQTVTVLIFGGPGEGPTLTGCNFTNYPASVCAIGYDPNAGLTQPPGDDYATANTFANANGFCN